MKVVYFKEDRPDGSCSLKYGLPSCHSIFAGLYTTWVNAFRLMLDPDGNLRLSHEIQTGTHGGNFRHELRSVLQNILDLPHSEAMPIWMVDWHSFCDFRNNSYLDYSQEKEEGQAMMNIRSGFIGATIRFISIVSNHLLSDTMPDSRTPSCSSQIIPSPTHASLSLLLVGSTPPSGWSELPSGASGRGEALATE